MLFGCLLQLVGAMLQRALRQQVHHLSATLSNPVYRLAAIHESQHLDTLQQTIFLGIGTYLGDSLALAFRHTGRSNLNAVDVDVTEQLASHHQLLVRQERHTIGLLAIAQRSVHNLYEGHHALICIYLLCCSHASILFLFATRKSISSSPFIRQCFL